ncbi:MAG: FlgD immunoglobulin-like domain containing protein [bacterium]
MLRRPVSPARTVTLFAIVLGAAIGNVVRPAVAAAIIEWTAAPEQFVVLRDGMPGDMRDFVKVLETAGGHAAVVYPPRALTVFADPKLLESPELRYWIAESHLRETDPIALAAYGAETARAARAWNGALRMGELSVEVPAGFVPVPDAGPRPVSANRSALPPRQALSDNLPYGAEYYDTSEFLAGSSAVGIWLLEAAGATYDWTQAEEDQTLAGVQASLANWVAKGGTSAFLTFFVDIHTDVPVSGVPIQNPMTSDAVWMNEVMNNEGWTGVDAFDKCAAYNNSIRDLFDTNWCFSIVIVDSDPAVNQGLFSTGGYAWAYYGGPWMYMSRYSTWAFNWQNYYGVVPMHELGHIYMNTDEYDGIQQWQGYLNTNDNASTSVLCIMNQNDSTRVCAQSKRQLGWRDTDGNGVIEPLDAPPTAALVALTPDPIEDSTPTWFGTAQVATIPNLNPASWYFPPNDMTVATIILVECRVDGGAWSPAGAGDGSFNSHTETFVWTSPTLTNGEHIVEARSTNSVGNASTVFGADTITVNAPTSVDPRETAAPAFALFGGEPNPTSRGATIRFSMPARGAARIAVYGLDGALVRTLVDGVVDRGAGSVAWDGRDVSGRSVASGVYLYRLETAHGNLSRKLVIAR